MRMVQGKDVTKKIAGRRRGSPKAATSSLGAGAPKSAGARSAAGVTLGRPSAASQLTAREKAEIALAKYQRLHLGLSPLATSKLRHRFKLGAKAIEGAVSESFRRGWVVVREGLIVPPYEPDEELGARLRARIRALFPGSMLRAPIVVRSAGPVSAAESHAQIGDALARDLAHRHGFRADDVVAIGSGRSCYYILKSLELLPPFEGIGEISIVSLTGSVFMEKTARAIEGADPALGAVDVTLDSDNLVSMLSSRFTSANAAVHTYPMKCSLAFRDPDERNRKLEDTGLRHLKSDRDAQRLRREWHALVGLGVFRSGHRLYDAVTEPGAGSAAKPERRDISKIDRIVRPIAELLIALANKVDEIQFEYQVFSPVTDIAHRLMVLAPPKSLSWRVTDGDARPVYDMRGGGQITTKEFSRKHLEWLTRRDSVPLRAGDSPQAISKLSLWELVDQINARTVTAEKTRDLRTMNVWLCCPTRDKARGVAYLLHGFPEMVKVLVIDAEAAEELIAILDTEHD
jgi:hypothetical protein